MGNMTLSLPRYSIYDALEEERPPRPIGHPEVLTFLNGHVVPEPGLVVYEKWHWYQFWSVIAQEEREDGMFVEMSPCNHRTVATAQYIPEQKFYERFSVWDDFEKDLLEHVIGASRCLALSTIVLSGDPDAFLRQYLERSQESGYRYSLAL